MNRQELLKEIGEDYWNAWCEFIMGKEVDIAMNGEALYRMKDIKEFKRRGKK